ncbi:MAG: hypothetical protein KF799_08535 [Bdellovibrionales bacterium]|nr:hypothetical protein [Bdellovibrionales bacterium]
MSAFRFLLAELLLIAAAFVCAGLVFNYLPKVPRAVQPAELHLPAGQFILSPAADPEATRIALEHNLSSGDLVVFGSSELSNNGPQALQNFYPMACGRRVLAVGQAGFQSLPILLTLAQARKSLSPNSQVVIILSPVWFVERGTPSDAFLRILPPYALPTLLRQPDLPETVRSTVAREIRVHREQFTGLYPDFFYPLWPALARLAPEQGPLPGITKVTAEAAVLSKDFDWDTALAQTKKALTDQAEGNPLGTTAAYYNRIKKYNPPYKPSPLDPWQIEKKDVLALSRFLHDHGVSAHFIMQPIHRRVYAPLDKHDRLFAEVEAQLRADGHKWTSYFTEPFDLSLLTDAAHFSDHAWVRLQKELCDGK